MPDSKTVALFAIAFMLYISFLQGMSYDSKLERISDNLHRINLTLIGK